MLNFDQLSFWEKKSYLEKVDCLIIGSGIVGLSTAIHLKKKSPSKKVLIVEQGYLPTGASTKNAGFACIGSPSELLADIKSNGVDQVFETVSERWEGLLYMRQLLGDANIGYQNLGSHEVFAAKQKNRFQKCLEHLPFLNEELNRITGFPFTYQIQSQVCANSGFKGLVSGISNAAEAQLNPGKMMHSFVKMATSLNIRILNGIQVDEIAEKEVETNYGKISFEKLVICSNAWAGKFLPKEDIHPGRAQVIVTSKIEQPKFKGIFHFDEGYYYFRSVGSRVLLGGGRNKFLKEEETLEFQTNPALMNHLEEMLRKNILPNQKFTIEHRWVGVMGLGKSKSPIIKQLNDNHYCGVRLGGMGVAIGTKVGLRLANMMI